MFKFHAIRSLSASLLVVFIAYTQPTMSQPLSNEMDIRVLIDVSGSMKDTDPNKLRIPALQVLTQLLPAGSKAGIWQFADDPKVIVPHGVVNAQWQKQASSATQNISSNGQFTDIGAALNAASFNTQDQVQGRQLHVILLTDGMVDVSKDAAKNKRARTALLGPILQQYINVGARVHTVGLSHKADKATLGAMAQATDGLFEVAVNADQLLEIFLRALDNTVITQQVPVQVTEQSFVVQQGVESMTVVIEKNGDDNVKLKDGKQRVFGRQQTRINQQWQSSLTHDVIRVQQPTPGTWALISDTATLKRVNVVGKLQILLQQSHQNIKVGQRSYIDVQLANERGELLSAEQLQGFELKVNMSDGNAQVFSQQQAFVADAKTRMQLPVLNQPGMYNLTISVANGQLIRTINRSLRVHPLAPLVSDETDSSGVLETEEVTNQTSQVEAMSVSNETASPALQSLMEEDSSAKPAEAASQPETAASQIASLVKKIKAKVMSPEKTAPTQPKADGTANENVDTSNSQVTEETMSSTDWRWIIGLGAGFILLVLVIILRRRSKSFS